MNGQPSCFGKLYCPEAMECMSCSFSESCSTVEIVDTRHLFVPEVKERKSDAMSRFVLKILEEVKEGERTSEEPGKLNSMEIAKAIAERFETKESLTTVAKVLVELKLNNRVVIVKQGARWFYELA